MSDFAFGKICQKISGIFGKNHLHPWVMYICTVLIFFKFIMWVFLLQSASIVQYPERWYVCLMDMLVVSPISSFLQRATMYTREAERIPRYFVGTSGSLGNHCSDYDGWLRQINECTLIWIGKCKCLPLIPRKVMALGDTVALMQCSQCQCGGVIH
jgi:hypothetical protein